VLTGLSSASTPLYPFGFDKSGLRTILSGFNRTIKPYFLGVYSRTITYLQYVIEQ